MRRSISLFCLLAAPLLGSCSLMGLGDFTVPRCTTDEAGDALCQRTFGPDLPATCRAWQCVPDESEGHNVCVRMDATERCDNEDNDCDGVIDEGALSPEHAVLTATLELPGRLDVSVSDERGALLAWNGLDDADNGRTSGAGFTTVQSADLTAPEASRVAFLMNEDIAETTLTNSALQDGCPRQTAGGPTNANTLCRADEIAVGSLPFGNLIATASRRQLYLGYAAETAPNEVVLRGPERRSSTYLGLRSVANRSLNTTPACQEPAARYLATFELPAGHGEVCDAGSPCPAPLECDGTCVETTPDSVTRNAARETELSAVSTSCGVSRPALDVIDAGTGQALVAFNSAIGNIDSCPDVAVDVEVIAAFHFKRLLDIEWVDGSNDGEPEVIGTGLGGGAPTVLALNELGYFVGHGDADGALALHFVPAPALGEIYDGQSLCEEVSCGGDGDCLFGDIEPATCGPHPDGGGAMVCIYTGNCEGKSFSTGVRDHTGNELDALPTFIDFPPMAASFGGPVDDVSIAFGEIVEGVLPVGVTWREGRRMEMGACTKDNERIGFRRMLFDVSTGTPTLMDMGTAVGLNPVDTNQGPPTIGYEGRVDHAFRVDVVGDEEVRSGGWFVAWRDRSVARRGQIVARRLSAVDGQLLDEDELIVLSGDVGGAVPDAQAPRLYELGTELRFAYLDRANRQLVGGSFACGAE